MGEILGLGITHYPALTRRVPTAVSLKRLLQDPGLPAALKAPRNWPKTMQVEWGEDEGAAFAVKHSENVIAELRIIRAALDEFKPDFILVWGDDQHENFRADIIPAFCVLAYDEIEVKPWSKHGLPPNAWNESADTLFRFAGHKTAGKHLISQLLQRNFDVAYAYKPLHVDLGHAFANTALFLDWDRKGFNYPMVPFAVNCYGRRVIAAQGYMESLDKPIKEEDFDPPSPSPRRCFDLGFACAEILKASPWRVALIASSSWSHAFMTKKHSFLYPDTDSDRKLFEALEAGNYDVWRNVSLSDIEESGQHELLNWFCLLGAMAALDRKPTYSSFIETNIMNSNKVAAVYAP
jgi:hypothetical protein